MRIVIIGTGNMGSTLGIRWAHLGHEVVFATREPESERIFELLQSAGENAWAGNIADVVSAGEVVVLATPFRAIHDSLRMASGLADKIVIDCTNPIASDLKGLTVGLNDSAAERIAAMAQGARVVKAFNTSGVSSIANPQFATETPTIFICGDDAQAKEIVCHLVEELGFDVCDTGDLYVARYLEPLGMLWVHLAYVQGFGPNIDFRLLKR